MLRKLEQDIIKAINSNKVSIDGVYFVMKSVMREIETLYFQSIKNEENAIKEDADFETKAESADANNNVEEE